MPVMRIVKRFDCRNMHARLLSNRCDAFDIAHGLRESRSPAPITSVWFEGAWLRMALMGICFSYAVRSPWKNRLIILLSLPLVGFELAAGGNDGTEQIRMVRTDLQRTCNL